MCCSPFEYDQKDIYGNCKDCGADIDEYGNSLEGCGYSPISCDTCGCQGCDQSC